MRWRFQRFRVRHGARSRGGWHLALGSHQARQTADAIQIIAAFAHAEGVMRLIVEMRFGSHLYGTATPLSDLDYKGIYVPDGRDILLQRVRGTISQSRS